MPDMSKLEESLDKSVDNFRDSVQAYCSTIHKGYVDKYDLEEIAKYAFYAFDDFKEAIIRHLKNSG